MKNDALDAEEKYKSNVEKTAEYVEFFDILETINNVGNDEVFTPRKVVDRMLDSLPEEVWHNPDYRWLNPASKTGIFEREIAIRLDEGLRDIIPDVEIRRKHILQDMIFSIGQTKFTANVARRTLYYCCQANRPCDGIMEDGHYVNGYAIGNGTWFDDAEGNVKTPCSDHMLRKGKCIYCGISEKSKYLDANQREKYSYDFIHCGPGDELQTYLANRFFKGDKSVKFDVIIGNPPYQLNDGGGLNGSSAKPIYQLFVENAISIKPKYICMIIPAKWYSGGKGLDKFREHMLTCQHMSHLIDYDNFKLVFPTVELAGGVCYFLWNSDYINNVCLITNVSDKCENTEKRALNQFPVFIRNNCAVNIVDKIVSQYASFLNEKVSARLPFNITTTYKPKKQGIPCFFTQKDGVKFVDQNDVIDKERVLDKWKFLIPKAPIAGQTDFSKPIGFYYDGNTVIAKPGECCSESWLVAGAFNTKQEAEYFKSYIFTKIVRFLILQTVVSQNMTRKNFIFVPDLINYNRVYDDSYLRKKWKITDAEWSLIESKIRNIER